MFSLRRVNIFRTAFIRSANMSCVTPDEYTHVVRKEDVVDFCARCVEKVGISSEHSRVLGEVLVAGDYRGHYSHGINRLGSNHYGIAGWYSIMAAKQGMIGISCTNTSPLVYPTRSKAVS
ncbi:malate dehydrogenase [Fasciola gigantica]|uniref:Malate dehydrogenase n=1 Tax=Fasciola gigantica TaxID=46835 RepID=A0A504Z4Z6_FASGI|nr:malate dehydrogenase [Fasciola gigantica]